MFGVWNTFSCRNKKPTPSNLIGSIMIIRVLAIHVPPCYEGGYLKPTPLKPYMTYDDHLVWPIHVPRCCEPLITPHLSLWGNARTRVIFPTHKKSHNPHPQGGGGEGGQDGYITLGGWGGCLPNPGSYIYIYEFFRVEEPSSEPAIIGLNTSFFVKC